jgi:hypothetical protein
MFMRVQMARLQTQPLFSTDEAKHDAVQKMKKHTMMTELAMTAAALKVRYIT